MLLRSYWLIVLCILRCGNHFCVLLVWSHVFLIARLLLLNVVLRLGVVCVGFGCFACFGLVGLYCCCVTVVWLVDTVDVFGCVVGCGEVWFYCMLVVWLFGFDFWCWLMVFYGLFLGYVFGFGFA